MAESSPPPDKINVGGIDIAWDVARGTCTFSGLPVAMMWVDTTLAGLLSGVQAMVGTERFSLALQAQGRQSVDADWRVISAAASFEEGFRHIATIAAVAGWGEWTLTSIDRDLREARFEARDGWEGRFQRSLGVCWGSGMLAGKLAGYCSRLFQTNCWADQTAFLAKGDARDEFTVHPSTRSIEDEIERLLQTDDATRADMAVALQKLRESDERWQFALEGAGDGVWDWNAQTNEVYFSRSWKAMLGYQEQEIGTSLAEWEKRLHPDDRERTFADLEAHLSGRRPLYTNEHRLLCKDGSYKWILDRGKVLTRTSDGKPLRVIGTHTDITERRRMELQLRHGQKMEAVGQLAGGIAHDFNNLLQAILGYTEILLDTSPPDLPARAELGEIQRSANRAAELTQQLLAFSRRQVLEPRPIDLNLVVNDTLRMVRRVIGEYIRLEFVPGQALATVLADPGRIEQVLMNLCMNARDAMPDGGRLLVETANVALSERETPIPESGEAGGYVVLAVTDTGTGMTPETVSHLFEPFFTTKAVGKGTGLGLATAYGIVQQHGGHIGVHSEPGEGSVFKVYLPTVAGAPVDAKPKGGIPAPCGQGTILLAEDEPLVRALTTRMLKGAGYRVLAAEDGEEALRVFDEAGGKVDLLLLDVVMPGLGGKAVLEAIRKKSPSIPCLFCSGYSEDAVHTDFVLQGGLKLLRKPFARDDLLRMVHDLVTARKA
jgi:two-component system, cell cycle sensor histidine kinase and response regulator CckA